MQNAPSLSHTRGVSLANVAGLCFILGVSSKPISVAMLAREGIERGILSYTGTINWGVLPTRINHHMIALRDLELVESNKRGANVFYHLTPPGQTICKAVEQNYSGNGAIELASALQAAWRPVLVGSRYVRHHWLKYFMDCEDFTYQQILSNSNSITISRLPVSQRMGSDDNGYRIISEHWDERPLTQFEHREIYEGLRRWTESVYLTDYSVPEEMQTPFLHLTSVHPDRVRDIDVYVVRTWLEPEKDLDLFATQVDIIINSRDRGSRISIPELIIQLCRNHDYSKQNVRDLLTALYYYKSNHYFFERGSAFLIANAFDIARPEHYYVQLDGVWRTSIIRY